MNVLNKVLVGLNIVVAIVCMYFAMRALKTRQHWGASYSAHEKKIAELNQERIRLINGAEDGSVAGIHDWAVTLHRFTTGRGRMWMGVMPQQLAADYQVTVMVPAQTAAPTAPAAAAPAPAAPAAAAAVPQDVLGMTVYVFQDPVQDRPGAYLGEFTVAAANGPWALQPARALSEPRKAAIKQSKGPWTLYQSMPTVRPELVDLPAITAETAVPPEPKKLTLAEVHALAFDYETSFLRLYDDQMRLAHSIDALKADTANTTRGTELANKRIELLNVQKKDAETLLAKTEKSRDDVIAHQKAVADTLARVDKNLAETLKANKYAAAKLAAIQLEAARRLDEKATAVAQGR
jgi:hypothetical protein